METKRYILTGGPSTVYGRTFRELWRALRARHTYLTTRMLIHNLAECGSIQAKWRYLGRAGYVVGYDHFTP